MYRRVLLLLQQKLLLIDKTKNAYRVSRRKKNNNIIHPMHICILTYKNIIMCLELEPQQQQQQLEKNFVQNSRKMNSKIL